MKKDRLSRERRSWNMSRIRGKDTTPELQLAGALHAVGRRKSYKVQKLRNSRRTRPSLFSFRTRVEFRTVEVVEILAVSKRENSGRSEAGHAPREQLLVTILNHPRDLTLAREEHWYRIPVSSAEKWLARRWPPQWLAFYETKVFGAEAFRVSYYARVLEVRNATRLQLFPTEPAGPKSANRYFQLILGPLQRLDKPIPSKRLRRIVFIPTTWQKFLRAAEINDLYDESPLEDKLWSELKRIELSAERQEFVTANGHDYALDFAFYCAEGKLDVETDGDTWHADKERIPEDNLRDNDLETGGWNLLRFNSYQLNEQMGDYCLPTIVKNIKKLGGLSEARLLPRDIQTDPNAPSQMSLLMTSEGISQLRSDAPIIPLLRRSQADLPERV